MEIVKLGEYKHYGLRRVSSLCDHFTEQWLEAQGLPTSSVEVKVGDTLPCSYRWNDGTPTKRQLCGTSALKVTDAATEIATLQIHYSFSPCIVLIGSNDVRKGRDAGELVMKNAVVLAKI